MQQCDNCGVWGSGFRWWCPDCWRAYWKGICTIVSAVIVIWLLS